MKEKIDKEQLGRKIKEAVDARIRVYSAVMDMLYLIVDQDEPESEQVRVENAIAEFIDDWAADSETAEGFGPEDAAALLEELGYSPTEHQDPEEDSDAETEEEQFKWAAVRRGR
jgi:hypothetical protein